MSTSCIEYICNVHAQSRQTLASTHTVIWLLPVG
uniref:Uncharacterized protein n=1 Tax=Anguilla anguilla TaxID=7936 RepID=A0A0E9PSL8_ANGAN